ncbi:MAG: wax ester/triacylglycerol synthase family O-acyltransferase [Mycobacterium sp.]
MRQLTGLDAAFLAIDSPTVYGHVGSMSVLDPSTASRALTLKRLTELVASRLHLAPPFRWRLAEVPFGLDQPYWIEDPQFDIGFHVRELALPPPGDDSQLAAQAVRLHARPLDRRRPLWEMYLIHGLEGGRQAVYAKIHHAAIDGVSGNDLLVSLLDTSAEPGPTATAPPWRPDTEPSAVQLLARSALSATRQPLRFARVSAELLRSLPALAKSPARPRLPVVDRVLPHGSHEAVLDAPPLVAPHTPFNKTVGPHRRWAFGTLPLPEVKEIKNAAAVTVNDVVLALCAGALRNWLSRHDALPTGPLLVAVPVSIRTEQEKAAEGNRVSSVIVPLPTQLSDPGERLQSVHEAMRAAKEQFDAMPADLLTDIAQFSMPALANQASRLAHRLRLLERVPPFNLFISNVPGPTVDLYMCGARLEAAYPLSAIADGQGLNITVLGSRGKLNFGILADRELVPDVELIMSSLVDELALLRTAVN